MLAWAADTGGGGFGVFPTLPDSAPGYAYPVVGATLVILGLIYYAAKRVPARPPAEETKPPAPPPDATPAAQSGQSGQSSSTGGNPNSRDDEVETSYDVLHDVIARLSRTQVELAGCRAHAERSEQRNRRLIDDLHRTQADLRAARDQLDRYADHARPLHADRQQRRRRGVPAWIPPPIAPLPQPDPHADPHADDPTDPIPGHPGTAS